MTRALHPRHGLHAPRPTAPVRVPGSIRRTSTIDAVRPDGLRGDLLQVGVARDLITRPDGSAHVVDEARVHTTIDYLERYSLREITTAPDQPALAAMVGRSVSTGFRAAVVELLPDEAAGATLLHLLLDDLPGAALVSGYALGAGGVTLERAPGATVLQVADLCSGFRRGGTIMVELDAKRRNPVPTGPVATSLRSDDELAWHDLREMGPHDMRRWRCLDLRPDPDGGPMFAEAYLRDSHVDGDGLETVVHEYTVNARIDPGTPMTVVAGSATAHSLPWVECIDAEASAQRLNGLPVNRLRAKVRAEFVGTTTCTHLNDTLRSLEDVTALWSLLQAG